jgi:hypothetical protein
MVWFVLAEWPCLHVQADNDDGAIEVKLRLIMPVDLLNPLATIQWERVRTYGPRQLPAGNLLSDTVMQFKGKLMFQRAASLWEYSCDTSSWKQLPPLPCSYPGLSTYHSQLVLAGGELSRIPTDKVWVSDDGCSWNTSLPPMPEKLSNSAIVNTGNTGTTECLIVGHGNTCLGLREGQWWTLASFPIENISCTLCNLTMQRGKLYMFDFDGNIAHCNLMSLLASHKPDTKSPWSCVSQCGMWCRSVSFQNQLLSWSSRELRVCYDESLVTIWTCEDEVYSVSSLQFYDYQVMGLPGGKLAMIEYGSIDYTASIKGQSCFLDTLSMLLNHSSFNISAFL